MRPRLTPSGADNTTAVPGRRDVPVRLEQTPVVNPVRPLPCGILDRVDMFQGSAPVNTLVFGTPTIPATQTIPQQALALQANNREIEVHRVI